jgi:Tfp pilus assembly protein PilF
MDLLDHLRARNATWPSSTVAQFSPEESDRVPILDRGVSLRFLRTLLDGLKALGRESIDAGQLLNGVHTTSVTDWADFDRSKDPYCLKSLTLESGTSFVETCLAAKLIEDKHGEPFFGHINAFVSYSRRGEGAAFANLVSALEAVRGGETMYFFIDVLVCAQHRRKRPESCSDPTAHDVQLFRHVIEHCSRLLLYATPVTGPLVLRRAWCLYEVMSALELGIAVEIVVSRADHALLASATADFEAIVDACTRIESSCATTAELADLEMIKQWVVDTLGPLGFAAIDAAVGNQLRAWLVTAAERVAAFCVRERPADDARTAGLSSSPQLLVHAAQAEHVQAMFARMLAHIFEGALGADQPSTAATLHNLGWLHARKSDYAGAQALYERALQLYEEALGAEHPSTATTAHNLAHVLESKGNYEGAQALYERVLAIKVKALGVDHPSTAATLYNIANMHKSMRDFEGAQVLYERAGAIYEAALGSEHPHTKIAREGLYSLQRLSSARSTNSSFSFGNST